MEKRPLPAKLPQKRNLKSSELRAPSQMMPQAKTAAGTKGLTVFRYCQRREQCLNKSQLTTSCSRHHVVGATGLGGLGDFNVLKIGGGINWETNWHEWAWKTKRGAEYTRDWGKEHLG